MNRLILRALLVLTLSPLAMAQTTPSSVADRMQAIQNARTLSIHSDTIFITISTLERALMKQKNWDQLNLNIVAESRHADLQLDIDRVHFTHIHTYVLTDKSTGIVLAAGRVRALDGVIASGPIAEQIVKILSTARLQKTSVSGQGM